MNDVYPGMMVRDATGIIGAVDGVHHDPVSGTDRVLVRSSTGDTFAITSDMFTVDGDSVRIAAANPQNTGFAGTSFDPHQTQVLATDELNAQRGVTSGEIGTTGPATTARPPHAMNITPGEEVRIPVIQEEAVVRTREVEGGGVRVHKTVTEREEVVQQPTYHEDVDVQRIAIGRVVDIVPEVREEGDTLIIPVLEEMLVVEKRLVLKEELRITRRRSQQMEEARVVLREEQVRVEQIDERQAGI